MDATNLPYCRCCHKDVTIEDVFCPNCAYPLKGTEQEQYKHIAGYVMKKGDAREAGDIVKNARNSLIAVAFLTAIGGLILAFASGGGIDTVFYMIVAGIYGLLAWWSNQKPFAAILIGLIVYGSLLLLDLILAPESFFKGIFIKVIIITLLVRGVMAAAKLNNKGNG